MSSFNAQTASEGLSTPGLEVAAPGIGTELPTLEAGAALVLVVVLGLLVIKWAVELLLKLILLAALAAVAAALYFGWLPLPRLSAQLGAPPGAVSDTGPAP